MFLIGKNLLIVMVPLSINKDVLVQSYNDLKFTIQNHNYFCSNLIFSPELELDMKPQTGSKSEKEYVKAIYCHPTYLTYVQGTSCEMLG